MPSRARKTFVARHWCLGKGQAWAPNIDVRDTGLLDALFDLSTGRQLELLSKVGACRDGFVIDRVKAFADLLKMAGTLKYGFFRRDMSVGPSVGGAAVRLPAGSYRHPSLSSKPR